MIDEKLKKLLSSCKCSVSIEVNGHRDYYESVEDHMHGLSDAMEDVDPDVYAEMVKRDTVVCIQFYPNTPGGFGRVFHYDVEAAIDLALESLAEGWAEINH